MPNNDYILRSDALKAIRYENWREENRTPSIEELHLTEYQLLAEAINNIPAADVEPKMKWIPVTERLPEEGVYVLIYNGGIDVAKIEMGLSEGTRERMKKGELPDPIETGWCAAGIVHYHRSEVYRECDEWGNNEVPYCWRVYANPATLFGQNVKYWMPLPEPPQE